MDAPEVVGDATDEEQVKYLQGLPDGGQTDNTLTPEDEAIEQPPQDPNAVVESDVDSLQGDES